MKLNAVRIGTAVLVGLVAAVFIRGVSGNDDRADGIGVAEIVSSATVSDDESLSSDIIDLDNSICPVMGLDVMDGQYIDWNGYRVHFCCAGCDADFLEEPEKYLIILAEDPAVAELLGIECLSCYPEDCSCETQESSSCGGCE